MKTHNIILSFFSIFFAILIGVTTTLFGFLKTANAQTVPAYFESFESGFGGWVPDHHIGCEDPGEEPCPDPFEWSITRSTTQTFDGNTSLAGFLSGQFDDGTIWIERKFQSNPNSNITVSITFQLWSPTQSDFNTWPVVSYIGLDDPEKESDFTIIGSTNQVAGWKQYTYQKQLTTSSTGEVWVGFGFGATWETSRTYYMDLVSVDIPAPAPIYNRVFVTQSTFKGNLGGLTGADQKCQAAASNAGLSGTFKAWLSDTQTSASSRLNHGSVPYKLVNGTVLGNDWDDLTDGTLASLINRDETNTLITSARKVWANTNYNGSIYSTNTNTTCINWTSLSDSQNGRYGKNDSLSSSWTNFGNEECDKTLSLYCFEQ